MRNFDLVSIYFQISCLGMQQLLHSELMRASFSSPKGTFCCHLLVWLTYPLWAMILPQSSGAEADLGNHLSCTYRNYHDPCSVKLCGNFVRRWINYRPKLDHIFTCSFMYQGFYASPYLLLCNQQNGVFPSCKADTRIKQDHEISAFPESLKLPPSEKDSKMRSLKELCSCTLQRNWHLARRLPVYVWGKA